jgi:hypothetical protein
MSFTSPFTGQIIQPTDVSFRAITLSVTTTLSWPINGSDTDNAAARIMNVTATAGSLLLQMPPANQASVGQDALIRNVGATTFTVADYVGNTIVSVASGEAKYIYITTNANTAGTWGIISFGVGSSSADAATLAGYGLKAVTTTLNQSHTVQTFASNYTALDSDRAASYVWTGGSGSLGITSAVTLGNDWFFMIRNGGTGTLTVTPATGLINGVASIALQPGDSAIIVCSGTVFYTVGLGRNTQFNFTQLTKTVVNGSYTLTSSEAANVVQKYTGTLTGNVTVNLPQTVQVYYITNQTDGGAGPYQITFTTGVGGGTATVPAGQQVILLCDSVNLLNATTIAAGAASISLVDGTAAAPSMNFSAESNTGIFRPGLAEFGISVAGVEMLALSNSGVSIGMTVPGFGIFTGGISGGTF